MCLPWQRQATWEALFDKGNPKVSSHKRHWKSGRRYKKGSQWSSLPIGHGSISFHKICIFYFLTIPEKDRKRTHEIYVIYNTSNHAYCLRRPTSTHLGFLQISGFLQTPEKQQAILLSIVHFIKWLKSWVKPIPTCTIRVKSTHWCETDILFMPACGYHLTYLHVTWFYNR